MASIDDPVTAIARILRIEAAAVARLADDAAEQGDALRRACALVIDRCGDSKPGRLVVSGVGKAGLIGRKVCATFASTGTPSLFLHPTEARHGDFGMVQATDVMLILSNSGSSEEILDH